MSEFFCGLDLGQANDPSALCVAQRLTAPDHARPYSYHVRHLERFPLGTSYPAVVTRVRTLLARPPLEGAVTLALDYTGVGRPVSDMFAAAKLPCLFYAISITGGDAVIREGYHYKVPKRDLIGLVQVLLQSGKLKIAATLPETPALVREMLDYRYKIDPITGHDTYNAREGAHDDLVLALALACWMGEHYKEVEIW
jgi:hypothetical protein